MQISGLQLQPGSVIKNAALEFGTVFPTDPTEGRMFRLAAAYLDNDPGVYTFNGTSWITGDVSAVEAGFGLIGGGSAGQLALEVDTNVIATKEYVDQLLGDSSTYSGDTDLVLYSTSSVFQAVSTTQSYCSVRLPDATTLRSLGLCYTVHNVGQYTFAVRDSSGIIKAILEKNQIANIYCSDKTLPGGIWHVGNATYRSTSLGEYVIGTLTDVLAQANTTSKYTDTVPLSSNSVLAVYQDTSSYLKAVILSKSAPAGVSAGTPAPVNSAISTCIALAALGPASVVCVYQTSDTLAGPYTLYAVSISVQGAAIACSTPISLTTTSSISNTNPAVAVLGSTKAICTYTASTGMQRAVIIDVANPGLTLTKGAAVDVTSSVTAWGSITALTATKALCAYQGNSGAYLNSSVLNVSGSSITVGTQTVLGGVPVLNTSLVTLSPTRAICVYSGDGSPALPTPPINLRTASNFAIFSNTSVDNVGVSNILGNIGVAPGATVTGFETSSIVGTVHINNATATAARADLGSAYTEAQGLTATRTAPADFIGLVFEPGVYSIAAAAGLTGVCTLDGKGDPNAFFVFKVGGAWAQAASTSFVLVNSANARNIYWQVIGAISLGAGAQFVGTALAGGAITAGAGSKIQGRMLGLSTVSIDSTVVTAAVAPRKPALQAVVLNLTEDIAQAGAVLDIASVDCGSLSVSNLDSTSVVCAFTGIGLTTDTSTRAQLAIVEIDSLGISLTPVLKTDLSAMLLGKGASVSRLTDTTMLCTYTGPNSNLLTSIVETVGK